MFTLLQAIFLTGAGTIAVILVLMPIVCLLGTSVLYTVVDLIRFLLGKRAVR